MTDRAGRPWYTIAEIAVELERSRMTVRRALRPYRADCRITRTRHHPRRILVMPEAVADTIRASFGRTTVNDSIQAPIIPLPKALLDQLPGELTRWADYLREVDAIAGVYFLCVGDSVKYVGSSINVHRRLADHRHSGLRWDRAFVLSAPSDRINDIERRFIGMLQPEWNRQGTR